MAVFDASREVARYNSDARAHFWFDANDPHGRDLRDIVSTYLYTYRLVNEAFPKPTAEDGKRASIAPGDRIILLTSKGNPIPLANAAVADQNIVFDQLAEIPIRRPGVAFPALVTDVKIDPSGDTTVTLDVPKPEQIGDLVIQSWDRGRPGDVRVEAITVLRPHSPVVERR